MAGWDMQKVKDLVMDEEGTLSLEAIENTFNSAYKEVRNVVPGFFTPFRSKTDFALTLVTPLVAPFALSALATVLTVGAGVAAVVCVGSLIAAALSPTLRQSALDIAIISGVLTLGCVLFAAVATLVSTVASFVALSYLATRSGAFIADKLECCLPEQDDYEVINPVLS